MQFIKKYKLTLKDFILSNHFVKRMFLNVQFFNTQADKTYNKQLLTHLLIGLFIMSFMQIKASAATLTYSDNLIIRDIDDQAIEYDLFSQQTTFELSSGHHTLVLKYKDVFEDLDFAEDRVVKSDYFVVKFTIKDQERLLLTTPKLIDLAAAERFVKSPELMLLDNKKKELILTLEKLGDYELAKQVTKVVTRISALDDEVLINKQTSKNTKLDNEFNKKVMNEVDAVPMLKYWWKKATEKERASFLQFVNDKKALESNN